MSSEAKGTGVMVQSPSQVFAQLVETGLRFSFSEGILDFEVMVTGIHGHSQLEVAPGSPDLASGAAYHLVGFGACL